MRMCSAILHACEGRRHTFQLLVTCGVRRFLDVLPVFHSIAISPHAIRWLTSVQCALLLDGSVQLRVFGSRPKTPRQTIGIYDTVLVKPDRCARERNTVPPSLCLRARAGGGHLSPSI